MAEVVICVDDCSKDQSAAIIEALQMSYPSLQLVRHKVNQGVGGAMITGIQRALEIKADIIVKMDGDGQMDASYVPELLDALASPDVHFAKGNRFNDFRALRKMPVVRRFGNLGLSFLLKAASGYWEVFDPTNGFFAIKASKAARLDYSKIAKRYFFESSLIIELYYHGVVIKDVPMPAIYGTEKSNLSVKKVLFEFPPRILKAWARRIWLRYFIYDLNIASFYFLFGSLLMGWGIIYGAVKYFEYKRLMLPAPTGTVMLPVLGIVLGFQLLLSAISYDIEKGKLK